MGEEAIDFLSREYQAILTVRAPRCACEYHTHRTMRNGTLGQRTRTAARRTVRALFAGD